jgi:hypothetical protein
MARFRKTREVVIEWGGVAGPGGRRCEDAARSS